MGMERSASRNLRSSCFVDPCILYLGSIFRIYEFDGIDENVVL